MDLRVEKTENAIKNAFLQLRTKKALEKITVKELCEKARINKSTFYAHYQDIYALSDVMEAEVVKNITESISVSNPMTSDLTHFTKELTYAFVAQSSLINLLFSGKQRGHLANRIEENIKERIYEKYPDVRGSLKWNVILSYCIQGGYWAFQGNREYDTNEVISVIADITEKVQPLYREE
ncbi:MAG: TetR/AcrR family transcriptional regulator [Lachnospiraceae bacterium]